MDEDAFVAAFFELHVAGGVEFRNHVVAGVGHEEFHGVEGIGDLLEAGGDELVEIFSAASGEEDRVGDKEVGAVEGGFIGGVHFIEDGEDGFIDGAEFLEDGEGGLVVLDDVGVGDVEDVDQEIGEDDFFERGLEGFDETVGQAADETDGVGDEELLVAAELKLAGGGVEGREEFIFGENGGAGEGVEEGRFAGVGVADDGGGGDGDALAFLALGGALFADVDELALEGDDAVVDEAAVLLELGFALAAHAAGTALAGEMAPSAGEAREGILHAGEGDLEDGLAGLGTVGEDLEDDFLAVDDGEFGEFFPIALLSGREGLVENDDVAALGFGEFDEFLGLAAAEEGGGGRDAELNELGADDGELEVFDELGEFGEELGAFAGGHRFGLYADKEGAFDFFWAFVFEEIGHQVFGK